MNELFRRHMALLATLPGYISEFSQSDFGYEWRCEFAICAPPTTQAQMEPAPPMELHFSLIDLETQSTPAAALYLVVHGQGDGTQERLALPLEDLAETHERLVEALVREGAVIEILENASHFMAALDDVKASLGSYVTWA